MNTHVIVFHDGSRKFITKPTHDAIWSLSGSGQEKLKIGDSLIAFSSIAKILSLSEFREQYPNEQTDLFYKPLTPLLEIPKLTNTKNPLWLKDMIKGLKRYITSTEENPVMPNGKDAAWYQGTDAPLAILCDWEKRLKNLESQSYVNETM